MEEIMRAATQLNFHHNFSEPVRLANTTLFYDPVATDRWLTRLFLENNNEDRDEDYRKISAPRR